MMRGSRVVAGREPSRDEAGQSVPSGSRSRRHRCKAVPMVAVGGSPLKTVPELDVRGCRGC